MQFAKSNSWFLVLPRKCGFKKKKKILNVFNHYCLVGFQTHNYHHLLNCLSNSEVQIITNDIKWLFLQKFGSIFKVNTNWINPISILDEILKPCRIHYNVFKLTHHQNNYISDFVHNFWKLYCSSVLWYANWSLLFWCLMCSFLLS